MHDCVMYNLSIMIVLCILCMIVYRPTDSERACCVYIYIMIVFHVCRITEGTNGAQLSRRAYKYSVII